MKYLATFPALHMNMLMAVRMGFGALVTTEFILRRLVLHDLATLCKLVQIPVDRSQIDLYPIGLHIFIDIIGTEAVFLVQRQILHDGVLTLCPVFLLLLIVLHYFILPVVK